MGPSCNPPHVVIIGGGFAGLAAAKALRKASVRVTLVDRRNHHLFQPLLYQVATAALDPSDIAHPLRALLRRQKNARVVLAEVEDIDLDARKLGLDQSTLDYDYLVVATGATHSYFGNSEWAELAPGLKSIEDALEIRRRILLSYEAAEREPDPNVQRQWLTFAVVGAGPTGVELAGALAEIAHHALDRDFRNIDPSSARVILIEGGERILSSYSPESSEKAEAQLHELGVEIRTSSLVTDIDDAGLEIGDERVEARTVLWAAGVRASSLGAKLGAELDGAGRVRVGADLTVAGRPEVFVAGDLAAVEQDGAQVPGVAPAAMQAGRYVADVIRARLAGKQSLPFHYQDKGAMATIGRGAAVVETKRRKLSGFVAWMMWMAVHIYFLIGFRQRFFVMMSWAWSYLTFRRGSRLITGSEDKRLPPGPEPKISET